MDIKNKIFISKLIDKCIEDGHKLSENLDEAKESFLENERKRLGLWDLDKSYEEMMDDVFDTHYEEERQKWLENTDRRLNPIEQYTREKVFRKNSYFIEACLEDLCDFKDKFERNKWGKEEVLKFNSDKDCLEFGNGFWITKEGRIYNKKSGECVGNAQRSGFYLLSKLVNGGKDSSHGPKDCKHKGDDTGFRWSTIIKAKRTIIRGCGKVITENAKGEFYYSYKD
jgi:hypothetical protein